jgi:hypothetical protein
VVVGFLCAGFPLLIFFPAPAALGKFFGVSLTDDDLPLAVMSLLRAVSAAFFLPRWGITTTGTYKLNNSRSSVRVKPLSKLKLATLPGP